MRRSTPLTAVPALTAMLFALALVGCEEPGDVGPADAMESTDAMPDPDDATPVPEGSDGADVDRDDATTGTEPSDETGAQDSTDDGGEPEDESSTGEDAAESTGEPAVPPIPCHEDPYEDNDELGFSAGWDDESLGARSCGLDADWFQLLQPKAQFVRLEHAIGPSPSGEPFATLRLEAWCGLKQCEEVEAEDGIATLDFAPCGCPEGERRFVSVVAKVPGNPPGGTRYGLRIIEIGE